MISVDFYFSGFLMGILVGSLISVIIYPFLKVWYDEKDKV